MASSAEQVRRALGGTVLEGLPVRHRDDDVVVLEGVEPGQLLECWRAARAVLPRIGRWPLAITRDWDLGLAEGPGEQRLRELRSVGPAMEDQRVFRRRVADVPRAQEEWHHYLESSFPGVGLPAAMARELPDPVLDDRVDRWIYERLIAEPSVTSSIEERIEWSIGTRAWYQPDSVDLAVLPTPSPWLAGAWVDYFGAHHDPDALVAAMCRWNNDWQAELVASWGTMLQLTVGRRPRTAEEAWALSGQLLAWARSLQMAQWELAVVLTRSETWFLHDRP